MEKQKNIIVGFNHQSSDCNGMTCNGTTKTFKAMANWKHYFICKGARDGETNCGKIFFNDDDNVCFYCGSKNTRVIYDIKFKRLKRF